MNVYFFLFPVIKEMVDFEDKQPIRTGYIHVWNTATKVDTLPVSLLGFNYVNCYISSSLRCKELGTAGYTKRTETFMASGY
jgi:hypothetical protein